MGVVVIGAKMAIGTSKLVLDANLVYAIQWVPLGFAVTYALVNAIVSPASEEKNATSVCPITGNLGLMDVIVSSY